MVVTGAGGGLGRAYSVYFGTNGANVVVNDVSKENAQKVVDAITKGDSESPSYVYFGLRLRFLSSWW